MDRQPRLCVDDLGHSPWPWSFPVPRPHTGSHQSGAEREAPASREHRDQTFSGRVRLDHAVFIGCRFRGATLVYAGIGPTQISGCAFEETLFEFDGPAANALAFLQAMSHPGSGLRDVVKASFPRIFAH
jgi:hypothetical protein